MDYKELLKSKGFSLNEYPEGKFWELVVENDEQLKEKLCNIFNAEIDLFTNGTDIDTLILQCTEDFTGCIFYYDCNPFDMGTKEFMNCITRIPEEKCHIIKTNNEDILIK
jgi:hypothetical protein